jgi:hypothetical protein
LTEVEIGERLREAASRALDDGDPLEALRASRRVRDLLVEWDGHLARQALTAGETWESIGAALGISRQAAWERLRPGVARLIQADRQRLEQQKTRLEEEHRRWPSRRT